MTPAELAQLLRDNPDVAVIPERGNAPTATQQATRQAAVMQAQAEPSEEESQIAVIAWADSQTHPALKWLMHTPNGGHRSPATAGRMKALGQRPGVPDLLLYWRDWDGQAARYVGLAIEMKRKPNKPTAEQREWLAHLEAQDWRCEVCYSAQAAIDVIREYLELD